MNLIPVIAEALGLKINEEFSLDDNCEEVGERYKFTEDNVVDYIGGPMPATVLKDLILGKYRVEKIAPPDDSLRLCYVEDGVMYFADDMKKIQGDDWDDAPYQHNAGTPFGKHLKAKIFFNKTWDVKEPKDNGDYSVDDINRGAVAWLYSDKAGGLWGRATIGECIQWLRKAGLEWAEAHK